LEILIIFLFDIKIRASLGYKRTQKGKCGCWQGVCDFELNGETFFSAASSNGENERDSS